MSRLEQRVFEGLKDLPRIPELDFIPNVRYLVSTPEEVLHPIIEANNVIITAGAFFGDESKGKLVDAIARHPEIALVLRLNSGENAGHTIHYQGKKYVFHLMPSGMFIPDTTCGIGQRCVMDPVSFMNKEVAQVVRVGIKYKSKLFVDNVHIVTPYHKLMDFLGNPTNSSTLKGMSPAHASMMKKRGLRLDHLYMGDDFQRKRLVKDMEDYRGMLLFKGVEEPELLEMCLKVNEKLERIPKHVIDFLREPDQIEHLIDLYRKTVVDNDAFPSQRDVSRLLRQTLRDGKRAALELSQSYLLSNAVAMHWSSSTSADTTTNGIIASSGVNLAEARPATVNVLKFPSSRVGLGSNPVGWVNQTYYSDKNIETLEDLAGVCENYDEIQRLFTDSIQNNGILKPTMYKDENDTELLITEAMAISSSRKHGECGATTKKPRVLGFLDLVVQQEVNEVQGPYLALSAVDRLDGDDKVGLCIAYIYHNPEGKKTYSKGRWYENGTIIKPGDEVPNEQVLEHCQPIIKVMDGWKDTPIAADKRNPDDPLPQQVQDLVAAVEHYTGSTVLCIGNGPETENLIYLQRAA